MNFELSAAQSEAQRRVRAFVNERIMPFASEFDTMGEIPDTLIKELGQAGLWGVNIGAEFGGQGLDATTAGLLYQEIGRGSCSLLSLFAVHGMVAHAIGKLGSPAQKTQWLPRLSAGHTLAAFALTEPEFGSDAAGIMTSVDFASDELVVNGVKKWISFAPRADLYLVFARCKDDLVALLIERSAKGLAVSALPELLSFKAAQLGEITLVDCRVPKENMLSANGFGLSHLMSSCLDYGRHCIAWGSVGLAQACLTSASEYAAQRVQFGKRLNQHPLIQEMLTEMIANVAAARLLCHQAASLRDAADPSMILESALAKYFASRVAVRAATDALQIFGAAGFSCDRPIERYFRDARALEVIEGSSQILQMLIAENYR